jgi:hypothetical protein
MIDFQPYGLVNFWVGSAFHTTMTIPLQDGCAKLERNCPVKTAHRFVALVELGFRKLS